jgi:hypothetical protein
MGTPTKEQIDALDALQATKNGTRGVSCVRSIVHWLRRGDYQSALATCRGENDKITSYPDIQKLLYQMFPEYLDDWVRLCTGLGRQVKGPAAEVLAERDKEPV